MGWMVGLERVGALGIVGEDWRGQAWHGMGSRRGGGRAGWAWVVGEAWPGQVRVGPSARTGGARRGMAGRRGPGGVGMAGRRGLDGTCCGGGACAGMSSTVRLGLRSGPDAASLAVYLWSHLFRMIRSVHPDGWQ